MDSSALTLLLFNSIQQSSFFNLDLPAVPSLTLQEEKKRYVNKHSQILDGHVQRQKGK